MAKTAPSPKANLLRGVYTKLAPAMKRMTGEMGRVRGTAVSSEREFDKSEAGILSLLREQLGRAGQPVVTVEEAAPAGEHWLVSGINSRRNMLYARGPLSISIAFVEKNGTCPVGAVMLPMEDVCVLAEVGLGVSGEGFGRMRVGGRLELRDTLAMVPWKTADAIGIMKTLDKETIHTRKSGSTMADVVDVCMGRADMLVATQVNRLEALLTNLMLAESGGFASDMKGKPLGPESDTLIGANPKLHAKLVDLLKA